DYSLLGESWPSPTGEESRKWCGVAPRRIIQFAPSPQDPSVVHNAVQRFGRSAVPPLLGAVAIALLTLACYRLQVNLAITAFLYLIVIVLVSVPARLPGAWAVSALAGGPAD